MKLAIRTAACVAALLLIATPGQADPKKDKPGRGPSHKTELKVRGGPPPWAPAHGLRNRGGSSARQNTAYVAPFDIDVGRCNRDLLGAALGGAAGGLLGSQVGKGDGQVVATAAGTVIGMLIGGAIGRSMDEVDQNCVGQILEHATDGQEIVWSEGAGGPRYQVVPTETYQTDNGIYCREYQGAAVIGGTQRQIHGTACRQPDGAWKLSN